MIFFSIALLMSSLTLAQTSAKEILFLDLNNSPTEIEVARKTAQLTGKKLVVYPRDQATFDNAELKKLLTGSNFSSLVLSGHNGGSDYGGENGNVSVHDLINDLQETGHTDKIESLYLLGCNSANKSKIYFWKEGIPGLKFIAGYDGSAPLAKDARGLKYFADALKKERPIINSKSETAVKSLIANLSSVNDFHSAVYASCKDKNEYLYMPGRSGKEKFGRLNSSECTEKIKEFKDKYLTNIKSFWSAEKEPTLVDPSSGFLKDAYVFMRQNEHCLSSKTEAGLYDEYSGDNLLLLRFNKDFNTNFVDYYKEELKEFLEDLESKEADPEMYASEANEREKNLMEKLETLSKNSSLYKNFITTEIKSLKGRQAKILQNPAITACWTNFTPSCNRYEKDFRAYVDYDIQIMSLEGVEDEMKYKIESYQSQKENLKVSIKDSVMADNKDPRMKTLKDNLRKALSTPEKMTRKEMLDISYSLGSIRQSSPQLAKMKHIFEGSDDLSGDSFPFSWHERIKGKTVEAPLRDSLLKVDYLGHRFKGEFEPLKELIKNYYY